MITIKNREMIIPRDDRLIGTSSDNNSETRIFVIDRYLANGIDLAALTFGMDMEYEDGSTRNATYLTKEILDDVINLTWGIVAGDVQIPGTMFAQITAFDYDGTVKWATKRNAFYIEPVIGTAEEYTGDLSAFQRMEAVLDEKLTEMDEFFRSIDDIEAAEAARAIAEEGRVGAEADRVTAEEGRVLAENERNYAEALRQQAYSAILGYKDDSEAWAVGTKGGVPVDPDSPQYQNSSKDHAELAATSEANAHTSEVNAATSESNSETHALKSEGYAIGKQNNIDVSSDSPYYHNNSKYYAEMAATSETNAAESADNAEAALEEINTKINMVVFSVDFSTGNLMYTEDTGYNFSVNETSGNLEWEVA